MMRLIWFLFYLYFGGVSSLSTKYSLEEEITTEFELTIYDLQDAYDSKMEATKGAYLKHHFERKELLEKKLGNSFKTAKTQLSSHSDIPEEILNRWSLLNRPGDFALPENEWNQLVEFSNSVEKLREGVNLSCSNNGSFGCVASKQEIGDALEDLRNISVLQTKLSVWHKVLAEKQGNFSSVLQLLNNASEANEQFNINSYWEMLSGYNDGFLVSEGLWNEIKPLYDKLHSFVKKRLFTYYNYSMENLNETDAFPAFMTGSLLGDDWSSVADIILPRPYLLYDAKFFLHTKSSKEVFQHAESVANKLGFPKFKPKFWSSSIFDHPTCPNLLLTFCEEKHVEVLTCSRTSWKQYLEAHEMVIKGALRNMEYEVYPLTELRGSAFDEAVVGLASFFAVNAMEKAGVVKKMDVEEGKDVYEKEPTLLLLTAMRVLPKLAFYYAVDKWRLAALQEPSENLGETWENIRKEIQGLKGVNGEQYDFLNDEHITSNKPYLSKFLGIFLQFQIIEYFKSYIYNEGDTVFDVITEDTTLINVIKDRLKTPWLDLININFGISEISAQALLDYFRPLEEYLENVPSKFVAQPPFTTEPPTTPTTESLKRSAFTTENRQTTTEFDSLSNNGTTEIPVVIIKKPPAETPKQNAGMYVGLGILACVAVLVVVVLVKNRLKRRRRSNNNRRYET